MAATHVPGHVVPLADRQLSRCWGTRRRQQVDLVQNRPNGAGKTTALRMIYGITRPTRGSIHVFGIDIARESRRVFRRNLLARLEGLLQQGLLDLPPTLNAAGVHALLEELKHTKWHVRIEPPYADGRGLVVYLARYLRGGPVKNHRLLGFTGSEVSLRYRHRRTQQRPKWRTMTLSVDDFLDRLCEHVPVTGLHMVRAYGLYSGREHATLDRCRFRLQPRCAQPPVAPPAEPERCPRCGAPLTVIVSRTPFPFRRAEKPTGLGPPVLARSN